MLLINLSNPLNKLHKVNFISFNCFLVVQTATNFDCDVTSPCSWEELVTSWIGRRMLVALTWNLSYDHFFTYGYFVHSFTSCQHRTLLFVLMRNWNQSLTGCRVGRTKMWSVARKQTTDGKRCWLSVKTSEPWEENIFHLHALFRSSHKGKPVILTY